MALVSLSNGPAVWAQQLVTVEPAPQDAGTPAADDGQADADDDGRDEQSGGDAGGQLVTQGEAKIGIDTDNLVELPFDRPFTITVSFENLDLRGATPKLTYLDFPRRLDVIPTGVCDREEPRAKAATFAGVTHVTENGKPVSKVRFFITGVLPNKYWLFCFDSSAAIALELSERAKADLQNELKTALWRFDSEIETKEREFLNGTVRDILNSAVQRFARKEGISGTVKISDEMPAHDLVGSLLDIRRAIAVCDVDTLERRLRDAERFVPEIGDRRRSVASTARASLADCLGLLRFAKDRVRTVETKPATQPAARPPAEEPAETIEVDPEAGDEMRKPTAADVETMLDGISRMLDRLENGQSEFAAKSMRVLQQSRVLILASSIGGDSVAQRYVSADTGLVYVPDLDRSVPYTGINLYLRPVNPPSVTPLGSGQQGNFVQRFSFTLGFTVGNDLVQEETLGGQTVKFVDNWTDAGSLLVGVGIRFSPAIRVGAGAIAYRQLDSLVDLQSGDNTEVSFYLSVSLDVNVRSFFRQDAGKLFSGGTPTGEGQGN